MTYVGFEFQSPLFLQGLSNNDHCKLMATNTECSVRLFLFTLGISKQTEVNIHKYFIPILLIHLFYYHLTDISCKLINYMLFFHLYKEFQICCFLTLTT